jgi:fumarylacetoacetate (FAA) hydrolase
MKLATYKDGSRDGQLVVVSRDLAQAHFAVGIATRMQQLLDDWNFISPQLEDVYATLNGGKARHAFAFDPRLAMAPLPRAYQRLEGVPGGAATLLQQAAGDASLGATDDAPFADPEAEVDIGPGLAAITGDVAQGSAAAAALEGVRLLMLSNAWVLRRLEAAEREQGAGRLHSRPATAYAPVAVTPDELGEAWQRGRVHLNLSVQLGGKALGLIEAAPAMRAHFGQLIAEAARTRTVRAGSIVDTGTLRNADPARGHPCLADKRTLEAAEHGEARSPWLEDGDVVRIEMKGRDGASIFGAIEQRLTGVRRAGD